MSYNPIKRRSNVHRWYMRALLVAVTVLVAGMAPSAAEASIDVAGFGVSFNDSAGNPVRAAGGHPDVKVSFQVATEPGDANQPLEQPHRVFVDLPPGLVGDATTAATCSEQNLTLGASGLSAVCPVNSQIGYAQIVNNMIPVFNLEPGGRHPAVFGFNFLGAVVRLVPTVRAGDYGITMDSGVISQGIRIPDVNVTLWGVPQDPAHNLYRVPSGGQLSYIAALNLVLGGGASNTDPQAPLLSLPTRCETEADEITARIDGRRSEGQFTHRTVTADPDDVPFTYEGCDNVPFDVDLETRATSGAASSPSGFEVDLSVTQNRVVDGLAAAHVKDVTMKLPEGFSVSPSSAVGLKGCSSTEIDLESTAPAGCPAESKLGTVSVESPLLTEPLSGAVYVAAPDDNPFGSLIALYIVAEGSGVRVKLPGRVDLDPKTGQVKAVFENNPQLPFSRLRLKLDAGANASLSTPSECGRYKAETTISSWSGKTRVFKTPLVINQDCAERGFKPGFLAGVDNPSAGSSSNLSVILSRTDRDQEFRSIRELRLPEGLLGRLSAVELCGSAQADLGNCPEASRIGRVQVAAGVGSSPVWVPESQGTLAPVYLTEKYRGGAFGLSVVVPAKAGPFDLGRVVDRLSLHVDERTAQLSVREEQSRVFGRDGLLVAVNEGSMPEVLEGIPLAIRELRVLADREGFIVNPTDCSQQQITAEVESQAGTKAEVSNRFRTSDCARLGFAPGLKARILDKGRKSTLRSFHPRTRFTVVPRKGDANIAGARVVLPSSTLLDQANIGTTCTRAQMAERNCPEASIVGYAKAWSPLLNRPVEGPVYLAANGGVRPLPDLVAVLDGEIRIVLQGEVSTLRTGGKARLQNTFRVVPDAPVERFELTMRGGGKRGLLVNSTDLCRSSERGVAVFAGQNGRQHRLRPKIATSFKGCGKVRRHAARKAARKQARKAAAQGAARG